MQPAGARGTRTRTRMVEVTSRVRYSRWSVGGVLAGAMRREPRGQSGRLATLDGLRGIAVLLVMLYHFNVNMPRDASVEGLVATALDAGWIGVDLFFVLSGFLITG